MPSETPQRPLIFGEVLFDVFPDGTEVLGGAPFNVAWNLQAFGAAPIFVSRVGDDALGHAIGDAMRRWGMDRRGLQVDRERGTGLVKISYEDGGEPIFDIREDRAYDHIAIDHLPQVGQSPLLYHGSLALRSETSRQALAGLKASLAPRPFLDVNLRSPWWEQVSALALVADARWVKINADELAALVPEAGADRTEAARVLQERFDLETVYVTEGAAGAFARQRDGSVLRVAPDPGVQVVDVVGAGDAFASVLILGILREWPTAETLTRAQGFASAIVGRQGATVQDPDFYRQFAQAWGL
jgi:fructokinase